MLCDTVNINCARQQWALLHHSPAAASRTQPAGVRSHSRSCASRLRSHSVRLFQPSDPKGPRTRTACAAPEGGRCQSAAQQGRAGQDAKLQHGAASLLGARLQVGMPQRNRAVGITLAVLLAQSSWLAAARLMWVAHPSTVTPAGFCCLPDTLWLCTASAALGD